MNYHYPRNKEEYWEIVDAHWDNLYNILVKFLPKERLAKADNLRLNKDDKIVSLFEEAWGNAPDHYNIHFIPGWHILCDLCSEAYVLDEEERL